MKPYIKLNKLIKALSILLILSCQLLAQSKKGYVLEGNIEGLPDKSIVYLTREFGRDTVAKCISNFGKFSFEGNIPKGAEFYFLKLDSLIVKRGSKAILLTNDLISIKSSIKEWPKLNVTGSDAHKEFDSIGQYIENYKILRAKLNGSINELRRDYQNILNNDSLKVTLFSKRIKGLNEILANEAESFKGSIVDYINRMPNSLYTPYLIHSYSGVLTEAEMGVMYEKLTEPIKNSYYGFVLKSFLEGGTPRIGKHIGDFEGVSPEGKLIRLNEVLSRGKVTLIDFWASWCKPCRVENPHLISAYSKFHKKGFNILSVTLDKNIKAWQEAIIEDKLPWYHIRDKSITESIHKKFNVKSIPTYILLDSSGNILAFEGEGGSSESLRGDNLRKKLALLLN